MVLPDYFLPNHVDTALGELMHRLFADRGVGRLKEPGEVVLDGELWLQLEQLGLRRLTGDPARGGSGAGWVEAAELLYAAASTAVSLPLAEHDLLAGWLADRAELTLHGEVNTACILDDRGAAWGVPWLPAAQELVALQLRSGGWQACRVVVREPVLKSGRNIAGEPHADLVLDPSGQVWKPVEAGVAEEFHYRGALARAVQVCGALTTMVRLSVSYSTQRSQFGRPIAGFQAVQQLVADCAAELALAMAATQAAVLAAASSATWSDPDLRMRIAIARSCVGHAGSVIVRGAHQVHGAIGTTQEHDLHRYSKPVLAWRSEFGSTAEWDRRLTATVLEAGAAGVWPLLSG